MIKTGAATVMVSNMGRRSTRLRRIWQVHASRIAGGILARIVGTALGLTVTADGAARGLLVATPP
jgi:hypothetical protein